MIVPISQALYSLSLVDVNKQGKKDISMKQKILICGATGFIGRNMVERFSLNKDFEVIAVYNKRPLFYCENVSWVKADLTNPSDVEKCLRGIDIVIQAAATTSGSKDILTKPYIHVTDNAVMNSLLLRQAYENKITQFIFFSCTVMYPSSDKALREEDFDASVPMHPRYFGVGSTKVYIERMCDFYSRISDTKFTVIRHSNIYGPHDKFDLERSHVLGATITKVMSAPQNGEIEVWGTGEEERDFLHVSDLADFVECAIQKQTSSYELLNCGIGSPTSIKNLVHMIVDLSGKNLSITHNLSSPTIKTNIHLDCAHAKKTFGWVPKISLKEGLHKTLEWWNIHISQAGRAAESETNEQRKIS